MIDFRAMSAERKRIRAMTAVNRLAEIKNILETVDNRCLAADGPVPRIAEEITPAEWRTIYKLCGGFGCEIMPEI